jgi:hypothetical protein
MYTIVCIIFLNGMCFGTFIYSVMNINKINICVTCITSFSYTYLPSEDKNLCINLIFTSCIMKYKK